MHRGTARNREPAGAITRGTSGIPRRGCRVPPLLLAPLILSWLSIGSPPSAEATVHNIHLYTDNNPDYTSRASFLETATSIWHEPQDQAIALWRWTLRNQRQTHTTREQGRGLWDPIMFFNSYANTYCGYMSGFMQTWWDGLGSNWRHRYVELGDHTVSEVSWDAGATWHVFDTSMGIYCFRHDGVVASCQDIVAAHTCGLSEYLGATGPEPGHYYLYHFAPECGTNPVNPAHAGDLGYPWGYRNASDNPVAYGRTLRNGADSYISGFAPNHDSTNVRHGWQYRLHVRANETYTRYWSHLGETEDYYRPTTGGNDPDDTALGYDMRGNGRWEFTPDLTGTDYRRVLYSEVNTIHRTEAGGTGPQVHPQAPGVSSQIIFKVNGANVITSATLHLEGVRSTAADDFAVVVSRDAGINWEPLWDAPTGGAFVADVPVPAALIGGAWECLVRITLQAAIDAEDSGLDVFAITTITQVNRYALPKLSVGGNSVFFKRGEQVASFMLWPPLHDDGTPRYQESAASYANIHASSQADAFSRAVLRPDLGLAPAQVTWRFDTPTDIVGTRYGGSFHTRYAGGSDHVALQHSYDGSNFVTDATYTDTSSPTIDGRLYREVFGIPSGQRSLWLRYEFMCQHDEAWNSTGIQDVLMHVLYEPSDLVCQPLEVTFNWTEHRETGDVDRQHTQPVTGAEAIWQINVAGCRDPTMNWVRLNLAGFGPGDVVKYGYADGKDVGPYRGYDKKRYLFDWLDNVAFGKPYSVSRAAAGSNPDSDDSELTNGCIIPPTNLETSSLAQVQTALWSGDDEVVVTIDLMAPETIAALRITTHQPSAAYCHAESIAVSVSLDGAIYTPIGNLRHREVWQPPGDYVRWGYEGSPSFADLPAGGRLALPFWLPLATPVNGRYVRCRFVPQTGRGLSLSEIQVLRDFQVVDWPQKEVFVPGVTGVPDRPGANPDRPAALRPRPLDMSCSPNPFNALTTIHYRLDRTSDVDLRIYDLAGRQVRLLSHINRQAAGEQTATWDGLDDGGRAVASGAYVCRLRAGGSRGLVRLLLVK